MLSALLSDLDRDLDRFDTGRFIVAISGCRDLDFHLVGAFLQALLDGQFSGLLVDRDLLVSGFLDLCPS